MSLKIHCIFLVYSLYAIIYTSKLPDVNIRGVVYVDHSTNVSAYKKLHAEYSDSPVELYIRLNEKKKLFFNKVHLIKSIRNDLLTRK